jgi:hypothetical protein
MQGMRTEIFLSMITIAMAFVSGALILSVRQAPSLKLAGPVLVQEIRKFTREKPPQGTFRIETFHEVLDPSNLLPSYHQYSYEEVLALEAYRKTCQSKGFQSSVELKKAWQWEESQCKKVALKDEFFEKAPLFHPSGHSFALLAHKEAAWNQSHPSLFHVLELQELGITGLSTPMAALVQFDWNSLSALSFGAKIVLGDKLVLIAKSDDAEYGIFERAQWDAFWNKTPFRPHPPGDNEICFVKDDSICWSYDFKSAYFPRWNPLFLLLGLSIIITFAVFILLIVRFRQKQKDQQRLKFTLEMLAHEIRTPVTNLALTVESFRSDFEKFPDKSKTDLLRLFDQVERIKRVAETSRNYLQKDTAASLVETNFVLVPSLKDFIVHTLDPYESQIELQIPGSESPLKLDPYWSSICIKNLVENALMHGKKPVRVLVQQSQTSWSIEVQDQGQAAFNPKIKGEQSSGFGLGLQIVQRILPSIHGELKFEFQPTRATVRFEVLK